MAKYLGKSASLSQMTVSQYRTYTMHDRFSAVFLILTTTCPVINKYIIYYTVDIIHVIQHVRGRNWRRVGTTVCRSIHFSSIFPDFFPLSVLHHICVRAAVRLSMVQNIFLLHTHIIIYNKRAAVTTKELLENKENILKNVCFSIFYVNRYEKFNDS